MGVLSTLTPSHSRSVEPVRGIGFGDKVAEIVPSVTEPVTLSFERALLYLCNLWQATGYASGVDGPVRSLAHHKWPFDAEQQIVFSTLADWDLGFQNAGRSGSGMDGGVKAIEYPNTMNPSPLPAGAPGTWGHSALITVYEGAWFTSWSGSFSKDSGLIMESGDATCRDVHDFSSTYGEFMMTGNDPTLGQLGSILFQNSEGSVPQSGGGGFLQET